MYHTIKTLAIELDLSEKELRRFLYDCNEKELSSRAKDLFLRKDEVEKIKHLVNTWYY